MELRIIQRNNAEFNSEALDRFNVEIYQPAFQDENEREPFENIISRLSEGALVEACPATYVILALDNAQLLGGAVYDWYPNCKAAELIYLAVNEEFRRQGIGRALMIDGSELLRDLIANEGSELCQLYFETCLPTYSNVLDSMDSAVRVRSFAQWGAKLIPINYVQPPLTKNSEAVKHLMLALLPLKGQEQNKISASDLCCFLKAFYHGLDADNSPYLSKMLQQIAIKAGRKDVIALEELSEQSHYRFGDVCTTVHYAVGGTSEWSEDNTRCNGFYSYETDLFNYSRQINRPFSTHLHATFNDVWLNMPLAYCYASENNNYHRITERGRERLLCDLSLSYTLNSTVGLRIAHLTLTPAANEEWSELDIIKLATTFGSRQEQTSFASLPMLQMGDEEPLDFTSFLTAHLGSGNYQPMGVGITELELSEVQVDGKKLPFAISQFFDAFQPNHYAKLEGEMKQFASMLCGLTLGIFDFDRMHSPEIYDTIKPIVWRKNSFMNLCRGHLLKVECDPQCEEMEAAEELIMSPYMLIPSTVMAHNELLLDKADRLIKEASQDNISITSLSNYIENIKQVLYTEYLIDVFQYASEREIIQVGNIQRGLTARYETIKSRVEILVGRLRDLKSLRDNRIDAFQGLLLALITLLNARTIFDRYFGEYANPIFYFAFVVAIIGGVWFGWIKYRGDSSK